MRLLYILEYYNYDFTHRYGFKTFQELVNFIHHDFLILLGESIYIYVDFFNEDKIEKLHINIIKKED